MHTIEIVSTLTYIEVSEFRNSWVNKVLKLIERKPSEIYNRIKMRTGEGNIEYYEKVLLPKPIRNPTRVIPEVGNLNLEEVFRENFKLLKSGYRFKKIGYIEEFIEKIHQKKRIIASRWMLSLETPEEDKEVYTLYLAELIYPIGFERDIEDRDYWERVWEREESVRFSNI